MAERIFKRGLKPLDPAKHARFKFAAQYGFIFPAPTYPIDKSGGVTDFGMGGNGPDPTLTVNGGQPVGDCGPNAVPKNANIIDAVLAGVQYTALTSNQIVELYFEFTGGQDTGVDLGDWLLWLFKKGLIKGFVKLQLSEMDAALALGFAVVVGVSLNPHADEQAQVTPPLWDVAPDDEPDPEEGHAILRIAADSPSGPVAYASWGMRIGATHRWDVACPQQAFGVVTDIDALTTNGFPVAALLADLTALNGTVNPAPSTPVGQAFPGDVIDSLEHDVKSFVDDAKHEVERVIWFTEEKYKELEKILHGALGKAIERELPSVIQALLNQAIQLITGDSHL